MIRITSGRTVETLTSSIWPRGDGEYAKLHRLRRSWKFSYFSFGKMQPMLPSFHDPQTMPTPAARLGLFELLWESNSLAASSFVSPKAKVLLHGFIKKAQKTPQRDIDLANQRRKEIE